MPRPVDAQSSETDSKNPKADAKKAKAIYQQGIQAEKLEDWETAYTAYTDATNWEPTDREYAIRREIARSHVVQSKMDAAERDAVSGRLDDARKELLSASFVDPTNTNVRERMEQMALADPGQKPKAVDVMLAGEPRLEYQTGKHNFDYRGDTQGAYEELGRQFGVEVAFDVDLHSRQIRFQMDDINFPTAARLLGNMTGTFWRPLSARLFFVTENTAQKRKDYEASVVRTVLLPASETPEQMTEISRMVRDIVGITRSDLDVRSRTLTLRASPGAVALATDLIADLEKPTGELILEIEILEVDRTNAVNLGIVPPQSAQIFSLNAQQLQEAQQSTAGLISVIQQLFGTPSSLSGLSASEIASLLAAGQLGVGSLIPPVVAFGGGATTFLATLPGLTANFGQMLSTVRNGRRILLRAQDGRPATFFVGDRFPVSLATFSPSLFGTGEGLAGLSAANFPTTNFPAGAAPAFVTTAVTRTNSTTNDLIVANSGDTPGTVGVLLGDGMGGFGVQTTFPAGTTPVSIAAADFNNDANLDLVVANKGSNNVSILLGNGDGTFQTATTIATGTSPVSVVAADFHDTLIGSPVDLAVVNQGDDSISIFHGNGDGTFQVPAGLLQLPSGFKPAGLLAGHFTNSGHLDLAVADSGNATISVFLGNGDGTFKARTDYSVGSAPLSIAMGDFNGDGTTDLAVADSGAPFTASNGTAVNGNTVSVLIGQVDANSNPTGTFGVNTDYPAGNMPTSVVTGDFNVDGRPDIAVSASADNAVAVLLNAGSGLFGPPLELPVDVDPVSLVTADFDASGNLGIATANNTANDLSVILNNSSFSALAGAGAGTPFPGAQYLDVGLKVKATPRIHPNDEVTLQLSFDLSSVTTQNFNQIPVISSQRVDQTVRLKQNETATLFGFRETQLSNAINGNPGLGELPVVGLADSNQDTQHQDTELLILVTPHMVRFSPRADHVIYAGQGSLDGRGGGGGESAPVLVPPPSPPQTPPVAAPAPAAPGPQPPPQQ